MAYHNHPYHDPRRYPPQQITQNGHPQYHQYQSQATPPNDTQQAPIPKVEVHIPRVPQYDGASTSQEYKNAQSSYQQPSERPHQQQYGQQLLQQFQRQQQPDAQQYQSSQRQQQHSVYQPQQAAVHEQHQRSGGRPSESTIVVKVPMASSRSSSSRSAPVVASTQARQSPKTVAKPDIDSEQPPPEIDYALLLINLAEEYFDAAYGTGEIGTREREPNPSAFCKLIATGLGCLEVALKQWKSALPPSVEAAVRLRYASILFEETENFMEAEEALSKGISHCERYRLFDLKYNMQHLLARVSYATNPKAAIKFLDGVISNAQAEGHISWLYALRFLRVSLSLDMGQQQETLAALTQLKLTASLATGRSDIAVAATACAIEAMTHINRSKTLEAIEQAQRALATVRSAQNNPQAGKVPVLSVIAYFVDLTCSLFKDEMSIAASKMSSMHATLEELRNHPGWTLDGTFLVPISQQSARTVQGRGSTHGIVITPESGQTYLRIKWLPKDEIYTLGYLLSAAVTMNKNHQDMVAEKYLQEAEVQLNSAGSRSESISGHDWRQQLRCQVKVNLIFAFCGRSSWGDASKELTTLKELSKASTNTQSSPIPEFIIYLEGLIAQGTGDTAAALSKYGNALLSLDSTHNSKKTTICCELSMLAALNTILIIHSPAHPQHVRITELLSALQGLDGRTESRNLKGAYYLVRAIASNTHSEVLKTKEYLTKVLKEAKATFNNQLQCVALNFMTEKFFKGLIGEQPLKSARAAVSMARKGRSDLWTSVAEDLLADCFEVQSKSDEAEQRRKEAKRIAAKLPGVMQAEADAPRMGWNSIPA